jgi:hypothetical protein
MPHLNRMPPSPDFLGFVLRDLKLSWRPHSCPSRHSLHLFLAFIPVQASSSPRILVSNTFGTCSEETSASKKERHVPCPRILIKLGWRAQSSTTSRTCLASCATRSGANACRQHAPTSEEPKTPRHHGKRKAKKSHGPEKPPFVPTMSHLYSFKFVPKPAKWPATTANPGSWESQTGH